MSSGGLLAARTAVDELYQTRVMRTILGGDIVYESQVISNDYAQTLTDLVEILAKESR